MKQSEIDAAVARIHQRNAKSMGGGVYMTTVVTHIRGEGGGHFYVDDDMSVVHGFVWLPLGKSVAKRCAKATRFGEDCVDGLEAHDGDELEAGKEYSARPAFIVTSGPGTMMKIISDSD
jgi:hypothetical protein